MRRSAADCGGVRRSVAECGGVRLSAAECGGVWRSAGICAIYQVDQILYHIIVTRRDLPHWIMSNYPVQHSDWWLP